MKRKYLALFLSIMMMVTLLTACGSKDAPVAQSENSEAEEMVLNWNLGQEPRTLDPQLNSESAAGHIINNTYEGLMREIDGKLEPAIAESYEVSEDGLTYTFHLRDTKWSDGKPLTAHDFVYSWLRALNPKIASDYAMQLYYVKGGYEYSTGTGKVEDVAIKALDDKTLQVELSAPTPYFLGLTAFYTLLPTRQDIVEKDPEGWARNPEVIVSNGPFKLAEYVLGDKIVLEKNENYWNADTVKLDKIVAYMIVEDSTSLTAYESGDMDIISNIPNQEITRLKDQDDTFYIRPTIGTYFYVFNVTAEPVNDVRVRKALTLALDRKAICENITKAGEIPATSYVPPGDGMRDTRGNEFKSMIPDYGIAEDGSKIEEAKALLAEAGYPNGEGFPPIQILYNTSESHKAVAEAIQEMWKKNLGIEVSLFNQEWAVFLNTRKNGQYTVARFGWYGDYADPMTMLDVFASDIANNSAQWKSDGYNQSLIDAKHTNDPEKRDEALYAAEKMLFDEQVLIPLYYYTDKFMVKKKIVDWEKNVLGNWFFGYAYVDESLE